jgi:DNA-binding CsgD family transcriptional regulator/tetratricopeptide (TPR) repeat protein
VVDQTVRVEWPLVGRDGELAFASGLISDGAAGGVVVVGAAGVGKTRLAVELARIAKLRGCAVEWVRATQSAASIPLGAFASLLPPTGDGPAGGAELLARARGALVERARGRRLVLCVDDGHLLDAGSASLVHQLVAAGEAFAVVTVRHGERVPDAVRALWKDELCAFVELDVLSRGDVERLLEDVLGGPLDGRSISALWELTRGNALFLRELVLYGIDRGVLSEAGGIWRWRGEVAAGTRLASLVGSRLESLGSSEHSVLEVIAVGAPLEVGLLEPEEVAALGVLEAHGMVERAPDSRRRSVDVAHPLHGEVVRGHLGRTRLDAIQRRLANALEARGGHRRDDVPRLAMWRLQSGGPAEPELFVRAAEHALAALDFTMAQRFARAALQAGGGFGARLALGRALAGAGRADEAERLLGELEEQASDDGERAAAAIALARHLFWGRVRPSDADAALRRAEESVSDAGLHDELVAQRVRLVAARGRPETALVAAAPLLDDPSVHEPARLQAAITVGECLISRGRLGEAIAVTEAWQPIARRHRDELPLAEPVLLMERASALRFAGRLVEATELARESYELALARRSAQTTAVEATALGLIWLARGRVRTALRFFRESAVLLRDVDAVGMLAWALAGIGQAAAQAGEAKIACDAVAEMERSPLGHAGFECELGLARAWSAAAEGELSRARALARESSELARARGQHAFTMLALQELCRLGDPAVAAPGLAHVAGEVEGPYVQVAAAYAAALVARDGSGLLEVAGRFADQGALLVAAEAASAAAAIHRDSGRASSARVADARAGLWLRACEGARPPTLPAVAPVEELTPREREIALLAAGEMSSRQIADRLVVSVRTVDNHLQRAYRKLGITRRQDLSRVFTGTSE